MKQTLRNLLYPPGIIAAALLTFLCVSVNPVHAQASASSNSGDITPAGLLAAGALIAVSIVGGTFTLAVTYMNARLKASDTKNQAAVQEVRNFSGLIENIGILGKGMSDSSAVAAQDRQQAALERKEMKLTLDRNTDELSKHAAELAHLRELMEHSEENSLEMLALIRAIQKRIGGGEGDPPLTLLLGEATIAAKKAADALSQAQQTVNPAGTVSAPPKDEPPSSTKLTPGVPYT